LRVLELFAGIGGFAAAAPELEVVAAIDASQHVLDVYRQNWSHPALQKNIEGLHPEDFAQYDADMWWMSPPCQPHTIRGLQKDVDDPRSASFQKVLEAVAIVRPALIGFENVEGFQNSTAHHQLKRVLEEAGYRFSEAVLCPSQFGVPNRRPRFLLAASQHHQPELNSPEPTARNLLTEYLLEPTPELFLSPAVCTKFGASLHTVRESDPDALTAVFTSAYTKTWMYAGSFLEQTDGRLRAFSPHEILNLLGFPAQFGLDGLGRRQAYKYVGNSLSVTTTQAVIRALVSDRS